MTSEVLTRALDELTLVSDEEWLAGLAERKRRELEFHDQDRDASRIAALDEVSHAARYGNRKYYETVDDSRRYVSSWIRDHAAGKVFLDYACGNGELAFVAARAGAEMAIGIDISRVSVENARRAAAEAGLANTCFVQGDAENTRLPAKSVDVIVCAGVLHHLDLSFAFPELRRILAPGGRVLAYEALDYNPLIRLYRHLTPAMRTEWEAAHILKMSDVDFARKFFDIGEVRYWNIVSLIGGKVPSLLPLLRRIDLLLTRIPGLQRLAWMFTFEMLARQS
jgi:ubiquinone/menaquinone biosynthesis C-methylase UbiE